MENTLIMANIKIIDCETTGHTEPQHIEIAFLQIEYPSLKVINEYDIYLRPTKPIEFGAKATHHILDSDLVDCFSYGSPIADETIKTVNQTDYFIGHNVDYDWRVLGSPDVKRIDTLAIARKLLPKLDSKSQSALMYYFFGDEAREMIKDAHNALCDVKNCLLVLTKLISLAEEVYDDYYAFHDIEELYMFSEFCRVPDTMHFGKWRGETYLTVAQKYPGYFDWWRNKSDTPPDFYQEKAIKAAFEEKILLNKERLENV